MKNQNELIEEKKLAQIQELKKKILVGRKVNDFLRTNTDVSAIIIDESTVEEKKILNKILEYSLRSVYTSEEIWTLLDNLKTACLKRKVFQQIIDDGVAASFELARITELQESRERNTR